MPSELNHRANIWAMKKLGGIWQPGSRKSR